MTIPNRRVAVLAPVAWRTPPRQYGAWEPVASNISCGAVAHFRHYPLTPVKSRYIILSTLEVLSLGPFSRGVRVRCSAVVNHPPDDLKSVRSDAAKP